jgi:hypothetical protein
MWGFNFLRFFEETLYKSNYIICILSCCRTHTKFSSTSVVMVTAGSQKITVWGPGGNPLGMLRVSRKSWFWGAYNSPSSAPLCYNESCIVQESRSRTGGRWICWQSWPELCQTVITKDLFILSIGVDNNSRAKYQHLIPSLDYTDYNQWQRDYTCCHLKS